MPRQPVVGGDSGDFYVRPSRINSPISDDLKSNFLVIKLNSKEGIAISYEPQSDSSDPEDLSQYRYGVMRVDHEGLRLVNDLKFISSASWHNRGGPYAHFDNLDELVDHVKDRIADAIIENREKFMPRLGIRGLKLFVVIALLDSFASAAFGQEYDPANDVLRKPEEPAAHLTIGQP